MVMGVIQNYELVVKPKMHYFCFTTPVLVLNVVCEKFAEDDLDKIVFQAD